MWSCVRMGVRQTPEAVKKWTQMINSKKKGNGANPHFLVWSKVFPRLYAEKEGIWHFLTRRSRTEWISHICSDKKMQKPSKWHQGNCGNFGDNEKSSRGWFPHIFESWMVGGSCDGTKRTLGGKERRGLFTFLLPYFGALQRNVMSVSGWHSFERIVFAKWLVADVKVRIEAIS